MLLHFSNGSRTETAQDRQFRGGCFAQGSPRPPERERGRRPYLTEATDGGFRVTATNPEFAHKMKVAESLSRRYRHALKELAK